MMRVTALGCRAEAALRASAGRARVVAALSRSCYAEAADALVWLGEPGAPMHPRAVLGVGVPRVSIGATVEIAASGLTPWRPDTASADLSRARAGARALHATLSDLGAPRGLARLLVGNGDDAVTARARPHAGALATACAGSDARGIADAGCGLLGLGDGLTPSGDDYVGGALFALRLTGAACDSAIAAILAEAKGRTHPISARLLADLAAGEGWAPLHALIGALGGDRGAVDAAARSVVAIGHSSGWDLLAGTLTALVGPGAIAPARSE